VNTDNKINHRIDAYRRLNGQSAHVALATIVETFGSTYQKQRRLGCLLFGNPTLKRWGQILQSNRLNGMDRNIAKTNALA